MLVSQTSSKRRLLPTTKTTWLLTEEERSPESLALEARMSLILFVLCHEYISLHHSPLRASPLSIFPVLSASSCLFFFLLFHFASLHLLYSTNNHVSLSLSLSLEYFLLLFQFFSCYSRFIYRRGFLSPLFLVTHSSLDCTWPDDFYVVRLSSLWYRLSRQ